MRNKSLLQKQIYTILKHYPETRNSDIDLTIKLWKQFYPTYLIENGDAVKLRTLFNLPREDHIKRYRAEIQNVRRLFLPTTPDVFMERARLSKEWKEALGYRIDWKENEWKEAVKSYLEEQKNQQLTI